MKEQYSQAFVGILHNQNLAQLKSLIAKQFTGQAYFHFLRWPHEVKWGREISLEKMSPEGQVFDSRCELRWKQRSRGYEVLLLSQEGLGDGFTQVGQQWEAIVRKAHLHDPNETRFPKGFSYNKDKLKIAQRYFLDKETATVHFIALTVES
ncbi:hypothetical protein [Anthocerotibacter panamensis]|uniref:hypothetical protein n=1 Tax=Anthocerotibacter panamensis TaxID=2857077 RepID=UPI001C401E30|nr:hypothetical protein [Anthocerotibacter panamensis]